MRMIQRNKSLSSICKADQCVPMSYVMGPGEYWAQVSAAPYWAQESAAPTEWAS